MSTLALVGHSPQDLYETGPDVRLVTLKKALNGEESKEPMASEPSELKSDARKANLFAFETVMLHKAKGYLRHALDG